MNSRLVTQLGVTAAAFLVVAVGALWMLREDVRSSEDEGWVAAMPNLSAANVHAIVITQGDAQLRVARSGAEWTATLPSAPIDSTAVDDLVTAVIHLQIGPSLDVVPSSEFGLSPPLYQVDLTLSSGEDLSIDFGATTPDGHHDYVYIDEAVRISRTPVSHIVAEIIASGATNEAAP